MAERVQSLIIKTHLFVFMHSAADEATTVLNKKMSDGGASPSHKSAPMSPPPSVAAGAVDIEKPNSLQRAWNMVQGEDLSENPEELAAFLKKEGADDLESFAYFIKDTELMEQFYKLLKSVKKKKLIGILKAVTTSELEAAMG